MAKSTQRINLGKPYEDYINTLVESGFYASATEVIRDALRQKMNDSDERRKATIYKMVEQARQSIREGKYHEVNEEYWAKLETRLSSSKSTLKTHETV